MGIEGIKDLTTDQLILASKISKTGCHRIVCPRDDGVVCPHFLLGGSACNEGEGGLLSLLLDAEIERREAAENGKKLTIKVKVKGINKLKEMIKLSRKLRKQLRKQLEEVIDLRSKLNEKGN